jgi:hypothetical protein
MPAKVFFSYSHRDEALRDQIETQLALLKRQGLIEIQYDRQIGAGEDIGRATSQFLDSADIVLLLVSPDFLASNYCFDIEMARSMERQRTGDVTVLPVILRPCPWRGAPFGHLNATPTDGKAISQHPNRDEALLQVAEAVQAAATRIEKRARRPPQSPTVKAAPLPGPQSSYSRPSNSKFAEVPSPVGSDLFLHESFELIARHFEHSLNDLASRNSRIRVLFDRIDDLRFSARIYRSGQEVVRCMVSCSGPRGQRIYYRKVATNDSDRYEEVLDIGANDRALFVSSNVTGLDFSPLKQSRKYQPEDLAANLWKRLVDSLDD